MLRTNCLSLDLRKALDTLDHTNLFFELERYGVRCNVFCWRKSYLGSRMQREEVNCTSSQWLNVQYGVPQWSTLAFSYLHK